MSSMDVSLPDIITHYQSRPTSQNEDDDVTVDLTEEDEDVNGSWQRNHRISCPETIDAQVVRTDSAFKSLWNSIMFILNHIMSMIQDKHDGISLMKMSKT
jgi:hypothetical protein